MAVSPPISSVRRVIGVNIGLIVLALLAAELIFGTWLFGPSFGTLNLPHDMERRLVVRETGGAERSVIYTRDRFGLRGRYADPASIGILALGGSTTNEFYVSDGETWTDRLGQRFAADGIPLSVVNAGVEGQTTVGHLRNFDAWFPMIPGLKTRYVLAYIGINDMALGPDGASSTQDKFDRMQSPKQIRRLQHAIRNHSVFYRLWRMWRGAKKARKAKLVHTGGGFPDTQWIESNVAIVDPAPESILARRLAGYRTRVDALIARIRAQGAEAIIVTQQKSHWRRENGRVLFAADERGMPNTAGYIETMLFNRAAMTACRNAGAVCVDLAGEIEFKPGDFYDWVHTSPTGSTRIADYLFATLKDRLR